jgi:hypothetical protein
MIGQPVVQIEGQGAVTADNLNTMVQGAVVANNLRLVTGLPGMVAVISGISAPDDGGQGVFYWSSGATAPDDNLTVIRPAGTSPGAWIRLSLSASALIVLPNDPAVGSPGAIYFNSTIGNPRVYGEDGQWHTIGFI